MNATKVLLTMDCEPTTATSHHAGGGPMPSGADRIISGLAHYSASDTIDRVLASQNLRRVSCTAPGPLSAGFSKTLDGPARRSMYADLRSNVDWPVMNHSYVKTLFSISRPNTSRSTK